MRLRTALVALAAVATTTLGLAAPASAYTPPTIVSPVNGGTLLSMSTGPLVIDFPTPGEYSVSVTCDDSAGNMEYYWSNDLRTFYSGRTSISIDPLWDSIYEKDLAGVKCTIEVFSWDEILEPHVTSAFTIAAPPLALGDVRATKTTFYPIVKDRYLDETEFRFNVNRSTDATLVVADPSGRTVYKETDRLRGGAGTYKWPWKGKTTSGKPVKPGRYRATVTATADGVTLSKSTTVRVATKTVTKKKTIRKDSSYGRDSVRGNCYTNYDSYDNSTRLDCWGGAYAATTFTFKIPADAKITGWGANYARSGGDICCRGSISKSGRRIGATKFQIRIQVTGWRSVDVYGARVSYKARVKI